MEQEIIDNILRQTRQTFYAYRNGVVVDALKRNGDPHPYIMGCQLVDLMTIARNMPHEPELARAFWGNVQSRECRMLAPLLFPADQLDVAEGLEWAASVETYEVADVLCHRLLSNSDQAMDIFHSLDVDAGLQRYVKYRLLLNVIVKQLITLNDSLVADVRSQLAACTDKELRQVLLSIEEEIAEMQ